MTRVCPNCAPVFLSQTVALVNVPPWTFSGLEGIRHLVGPDVMCVHKAEVSAANTMEVGEARTRAHELY